MADFNATHRKDEPLGALVKQLAEQTAALARQEVRLAQLELRQKGKAAGLGAGLFGAAGVAAAFGAAALLSAVGAAMALAVPVWAAILYVATIALGVAAALGVVGRTKLKMATPPMPEETKDSVRRDVTAIKEHAHR